jgi:hypothetical protein
VEVFVVIALVVGFIASVLGITGFSARDALRASRSRRLKARAVDKTLGGPVALGPTPVPAVLRASERLVGTTGWTERIHRDFRELISPDGRWFWAPIAPDGKVDPDFAYLSRDQQQPGLG